MTLDQLAAEGFAEPVLSALRLLTHAPHIAYEDYVHAIASHPIATEVKLVDLEDNSDIRRPEDLDDAAVARLRKYLKAYHQLRGMTAHA